MDSLVFAAGFCIIALAARQIGDTFKQAGFPLISGFLFTGIIAGPHVLNLIPSQAVSTLTFVDQVSLGLIAFAAGGELYLKELKSRLVAIGWITSGLVISTFTMASLALFALAGHIPFMAAMPVSGRVAVALIGGAILVARSPSSAIAIINELRAKGRFTKTVMGVTVILDVVVIVLFAAAITIADALLTGLTWNVGVVFFLILEIALSMSLGMPVAGILFFILRLPAPFVLKSTLILLTGYLVFIGSSGLRAYTHHKMNIEILIEPLLVCMVAGFLAANSRQYRKEFLDLLHRVGPGVYIAFFTLTGASIRLDILAHTWPIALILFGVRVFAIFTGSFLGGCLAGIGAQSSRTYWMAFITQAGVGLALAKEVGIEFPQWGPSFSTLIISVIILNEIVGPPLFKLAIKRMKEDHPPAKPNAVNAPRNVVIFGTDTQSTALAHTLFSHGWRVKLAQPRGDSTLASLENSPQIPVLVVDGFDCKSLEKIQCRTATAIVTLLSDRENLDICETAFEHFATQTLVARLNDRSNLKAFEDLNVLVVDPSTAIIGLLDHFVRAPGAASLLMGFHRGRDVADVTVRNPDLAGLSLRDLRLPFDSVIMAVRRRGTLYVPHGFTRLESGDRVTVMGTTAALREIALRFDRHEGQAALNLMERAVPEQLKEDGEKLYLIKNGQRDRFDLLVEKAVVADLKQEMDKNAFFEQAAKQLSKQVDISASTLFEMLRQRENEMTTVLAPGLAIPHIIIEGENQFGMLIVRNKKGIIFSPQAPSVHAAFVLVGTRDERNFHLEALSAIAKIVMDPRFDDKWLRARSAKALKELLLNADRDRRLPEP
ncbi:potassium transporter TrkA [Desulfobacter hydrogenophilus]|uniref:Potassium transporter TrkA n=1 Tax=Desulfobacter hydrogenophilus TaxID=2291 RepID=A0A328FJ02_9BACT|nr:PTS sugar transporter subunit IIA [Desulfobacter hydrogenophilus]NDY71468.1 PTS transporter subunit EIIA [Desulfobacter hydrogenophilus]QBH12205.1 potassium transporter TrkA [Desulfobacter hydrogenophilus]RAM03472.1 potassium transporter TrkA [Desulfobacter hydrogenophilus]